MPLIPESHLGPRPDPERRFRLLELVRLRMRERRFSPRTERLYVYWARRYIVFHGRRHPKDLGAEQVRDFLSDLAVQKRVSASTQNQALAALCFLYGTLGMPLSRVQGITPARTVRRVPVVLSKREVRLLLAELEPPLRVCAQLMYGSGLRLSECVSLRVKDVDFDRHEIVVRDGKGGKDRRVPLPDSAVVALRQQLRDARSRWEHDHRAKVEPTGLSQSLRRKYPGAARESTPSGTSRSRSQYQVAVDSTTARCGPGCAAKYARTAGRVVGSSASATVTCAVLARAARHRLARAVIFHSDRGSEYMGAPFCAQVARLGFRQSASVRGPGDNAHAESFFHSLKAELTRGVTFSTARTLRTQLTRYIRYYNTTRLHSSLGYLAACL